MARVCIDPKGFLKPFRSETFFDEEAAATLESLVTKKLSNVPKGLGNV